ncbi:MAG: hypothetical protein KF713_18295 [Turneriella sp.]|nr:hypothetical protein [Turneriella sp.]
MQKIIVVGTVLGFVRCMGVQVPEDYMADMYYGKPKVVSVSATTSSSLSSVPVRVKFATPMNAATVNVNTTDSACTGTIQVSLATDNFATNTCLQFSSLSAENRDSLFTAVLTADIDPNTNYVVKVLNTATDFLGKSLESDGVFTFKSGVPPGAEPAIVSAFVSGKMTTGTFSVIVTFSRAIPPANVSVISGDCTNSNIVLSANAAFDTAVAACNPGLGAVTPSGGNTVYTMTYTTPYLGVGVPYYFRVKQGLVDKFDISLPADYNNQYAQ